MIPIDFSVSWVIIFAAMEEEKKKILGKRTKILFRCMRGSLIFDQKIKWILLSNKGKFAKQDIY